MATFNIIVALYNLRVSNTQSAAGRMWPSKALSAARPQSLCCLQYKLTTSTNIAQALADAAV